MNSEIEFDKIETLEQLAHCIAEHSALLVWFSTAGCRVCKDLKPRLAALIRETYPRIALFEVDCDRNRATAAQQQVFTVPTLLLFLDGREQLRRSRHISLAELEREIARPYRMLFM